MSPQAFKYLWLTTRFQRALSDYIKEQPERKNAVNRTLNRFFKNPDAIERSPIHNPRHRIFHSTISKGDRLIDLPLRETTDRQTALLNIGDHSINDWASRYNGDIQQELMGAEPHQGSHSPAKSQTTQQSRPCRRRPQGRPGTYGEYISQDQLRRFGVPDDLVQTVHSSRTKLDLNDVGLDEVAADRVESFYLNQVPSEPVPTPIPSVGTPPAVRVSKETLPSFLRIPLVKFLAQVTDEQKALIQRPGENLAVVKGAAGTGKTVVGIRRIEHLLRQETLFGDGRILFVCYNQVLKQAVETILDDVFGEIPWQDRVEVMTAWKLFGKLSYKFGIDRFQALVARNRLIQPLRDIRTRITAPTSRSQQLSEIYILDEFAEVIYGRAISDAQDYVGHDVSRAGRSTPLNQSERRYLWNLFTEFHARCRELNMGLYEALPAMLAEQLPVFSSPRYRAVIIDEAQDLIPSAFQVIRRLQAGSDKGILVLGDAAQNVYRSSFRWAHTGLRVTGGHVTILKTCFRTTKAIINAATPLIEDQIAHLGEDLVLPQATDHEGPDPSVILCDSEAHEVRTIAEQVWDEIADGVAPSTIGIFAGSRAFLHRMAQELEELEVPYELFEKDDSTKSIDVADPSVKLITTYSSKGIEFPVVLICNVTETDYPTKPADPARMDQARRRLYTSMMRCAWRLTLSAPEAEASGLLKQIRGEEGMDVAQ